MQLFSCLDIPNYALRPTQNLQPIRNQKFIAVDAYQRVLGPPISAQQLERIKAQGVKKSEVLYQIGQPKIQAVQQVQSKVGGHIPLQFNQNSQVARQTYKPRSYQNYGKDNDKYRYNLYSTIDQPVNKCREFGLQGCSGCPSNQIIASRNKPSSIGSF